MTSIKRLRWRCYGPECLRLDIVAIEIAEPGCNVYAAPVLEVSEFQVISARIIKDVKIARGEIVVQCLMCIRSDQYGYLA